MLQSLSFSKTRRAITEEAESVNHKLLVKGGFVSQLMAGTYTYLPLGLRVIKKIENIIREEMVSLGAEELIMPALHPKDNWVRTGRWETMDDLFKFTSYYSKNEYALGPTHEEIVVPLAEQFIFSYKDLPKKVFQIQEKFRDEKRAKSGILRSREFLMKDLYSFHIDEKDLDDFYEKVVCSYNRIFDKVGIGDKTYLTFASGGTFSKYSHEFQTETPAGEDIIYLCEKCGLAINKEILDEQNICPECSNKSLKEIKAVEVGNIFKQKTKFAEAFDFNVKDKDGKDRFVVTGAYGIGLGRLMGTIVEVNYDGKGIIWPKEVAPFQIHIVPIGKKALSEGNRLYKQLKNYEVLLDDRDESAGVKLNDADLIGIPIRIVISDKLIQDDNLEIKMRHEDSSQIIRKENLLELIAENV
ncbi:TPA: prolyl-tRNA synthetase [candidate division CPR2 bacterium]|uniref:Proline--tRNA ligase n=1 Tax=candidate division CPR2 bacterium GW2011_GWC1_41_48 TaxID=1618344 RepID=A0A0G0WCD0_UNCC2|nr:MAG: Proline-tRNA ligase [candidate division CPR2 bacterium GW2011_GWC2_39_35]KKR27854.1 MAG: Proline-tRNA ligase [candidate division CPR2 bacterium GW2011_GWD2_39_7]KKR28724.1 MAG: Proline-tRNA ligase [candidate division CPR2 bacterium GW2011_GWD1_39_7]KKS09702.1 MAG: Proline-tRNA ligase [candidate division CPR2 bacterium GW2011_GWC1_41_48]OGB61372.1 MAG: hypothetical protein A2Y27_01980 [candidate division CPR2 bacterium GWD1_39_7]OGB71954.1 MAG: hypothetical protein A2Y26_01515 [candidat